MHHSYNWRDIAFLVLILFIAFALIQDPNLRHEAVGVLAAFFAFLADTFHSLR